MSDPTRGHHRNRTYQVATGQGCRPVWRARAGVVLLPPLPTRRRHTMISIMGCSPVSKGGERLSFSSRGGSQPSGSGAHLQKGGFLTQQGNHAQGCDLARCGVFDAWAVLDRHGEIRTVRGDAHCV